MLLDSAGNNLLKARELDITHSKQILNEWVGLGDIADYYQFSLSGRSSLSLKLDGMAGNADLQVLNSNGLVIAKSNNPGKTIEAINTVLEGGNYYIRVHRCPEENTFYNLHAFANQIPVFSGISADKNIYLVGENLNLVNASLADGNGISDVNLVNVWLKKDDSNWQRIDSSVNFTSNTNDIYSRSFNYTLRNLAVGNYQLKFQAYDKSIAVSESNSVSFQVVTVLPPVTPVAPIPVKDWFEENIQDSEIRIAARSSFSDGKIDRSEIVNILRQGKDNGVVDNKEFNDLKNIIQNANNFGIPEYVRVLANKVVNGDTANQNYQGQTLGNLQIGSSDTQLESLINKWFFGIDRPVTPYKYSYANGSLFQNGISYQDIKQGTLDDCYILAGLAATALQAPKIIQDMFIDNGDGTFTVKFYRGGVSDYVTVDRYLPTDSSGRFIYGNLGAIANRTDNELWVALAEKAYAQVNESGWIGNNAVNSYKDIGGGGYLNNAFSQITGRNSAWAFLDFNSIVDALHVGKLIGLSSNNSVSSNLVSTHGYVLVDYNSSTQRFTLFNPWGINSSATKPGLVELNWDEIVANFSSWDYTTT
jgi:Calpain family cysteine protease/Bacterial pre-peptidase C-terminal domain